MPGTMERGSDGKRIAVDVQVQGGSLSTQTVALLVHLNEITSGSKEFVHLRSIERQATIKMPLMTPGHGLGLVRSVGEFRDHLNSQQNLTDAERLILVEQAEILIRDLYAHLPLKRAMHAVDPLQRLRLLRQSAEDMSVLEFHSDLLNIFKELRDLHTNLVLPVPFTTQMAFLGILVEQFFEAGQPRYLVSKLADHLVADPNLKEGAEITHWNGMPMHLAVARNADKEAGGNMSARMARGLETLTLRALSSSLLPDEDWVTLTYLDNGTRRETRLDWKIYDTFSEILANSAEPQGLIRSLRVPLRYNLGVDPRQEAFRRTKKALFNAGAVAEETRARAFTARGMVPPATAEMASTANIPTSRPDEISARRVTTDSGVFGYLRLWTFFMKDFDIDAFLREVIRIVEDEMPPEGLIIDVRGNGGGFVIAAEFLLQLFTHRAIEPEPAQLIATAHSLDFAKVAPGFMPWRASLKTAVSTGALFSKALPLSPKDLVNSVGQIYFGPVVLITDAYCYSACDMFAAGFQDHQIGSVIGADETTGAGGANVLTHADLAEDWVGGPLRPLPGGANMRVSLRRTLRVGERTGEPVEDLGVLADHRHRMTKADLLQGNRDLLNHAGQILAAGTPRKLEISLGASGPDLLVELEALGMDGFDLFIDGRVTLSGTFDNLGRASVTLAVPDAGATVQILGFSGSAWVATRRIVVG